MCSQVVNCTKKGCHTEKSDLSKDKAPRLVLNATEAYKPSLRDFISWLLLGIWESEIVGSMTKRLHAQLMQWWVFAYALLYCSTA